MQLLAVHPYYKVTREVDGLEQIDIEHEREIQLYNDKIVTQHHEFPLPDVSDISYRKIGDGGLLYLYTTGGVYSYTVKTSPVELIDIFKEHIGR